MSAFTPGDWKYLASTDCGDDLYAIYSEHPKAALTNLGYIANADREADARLIAAAPKLLERLNGLMHRLETIREIDKTGMALDADIESARAVINEATGKDEQ